MSRDMKKLNNNNWANFEMRDCLIQSWFQWMTSTISVKDLFWFCLLPCRHFCSKSSLLSLTFRLKHGNNHVWYSRKVLSMWSWYIYILGLGTSTWCHNHEVTSSPSFAICCRVAVESFLHSRLRHIPNWAEVAYIKTLRLNLKFKTKTSKI